MLTFWSAVSYLMGWVYTAAWSLSFYPQAILNWRRKSVSGMSMDFLSLNPLGFACYTVFNIALYSSPRVRQQYSERHNGHYPQVQPNDIAFAVHALALSLFTLGQSFVYKRDANQRVSDVNRGILSFLFASIAIGGVLVSAGKFVELDLVLWLSYIKLYISGAKMVPQAWLNYRRKSTVGWSIENILLDFTGGTLSLAQLVLDSLLDNDWRGITGNPGKLGLSFLTLGFDIVFLVQHFVLYRHNREEGGAQDDESGQTERDRLLPRRHTDPVV